MNETVKKICLALDVDSMEDALRLTSELKDSVGVFKIGKQLFTRYGPSIVEKINKAGGNVFLDLKFHDIPNTVSLAAREATRLGVGIFNVHACGGSEMMKSAVKKTSEAALEFGVQKPLLLAVTVLTSLSDEILKKEIRSRNNVKSQVLHYASLAKSSGLDGVVASPQEIKVIRKKCGKDFIILTPGIRPLWSQKNDQKRTMTPREAIEAGANYIVIGRPITAHENPREAAQMVLQELGE